MRFFARFSAAVLLAGVVGLAACGNTPSTGGSTPVVQLTPAQVGAEAQAVLTDLEGAATAYLAANPNTPANAVQNIKTAEAAAQALVTQISTASVSSAPAIAVDVVNALVAVAQALPAGVVPADVEAGITAFQLVVDAIEPLVVPPSTAPVTAPAAAAATKPVHPAKGLPFRVVLVPNDK